MLAAYSTMPRKRSLQAKCYRYPHKQLLACRGECQQVVCAVLTTAIQSKRKLWGGYEQRVHSCRGKTLKHMKDILLHSWRDAWKLKLHGDAISHLTDGQKPRVRAYTLWVRLWKPAFSYIAPGYENWEHPYGEQLDNIFLN